jgi:hypothetical protein
MSNNDNLIRNIRLSVHWLDNGDIEPDAQSEWVRVTGEGASPFQVLRCGPFFLAFHCVRWEAGGKWWMYLCDDTGHDPLKAEGCIEVSDDLVTIDKDPTAVVNINAAIKGLLQEIWT